MQRCLELAALGAGNTAPNPMVGAVLVYQDRIIGEGWHQRFGEAHAEVNCIASVQEKDQPFISSATMYVSLEPCAHVGKTPPCTHLIIRSGIPKVVIGCHDPFKEVDGKGIEKLKAAGVEVVLSELETECKELNRRFFIFHTKERPYIILKWAQTKDGFMAPLTPVAGVTEPDNKRLLISSELTNRLVHRWRSEEAAILIGTNTALLDDPALTTRLWPGHSPVRLVLDMDLRLPSSLKIFNKQVPTVIFNSIKQEEEGNLLFYQLKKDNSIIKQMMTALYQLNIQSVLVEGGAKLLQSFIKEAMWDEARVITNEELIIYNGLAAPGLSNASKIREQKLSTDKIETFKISETGS